MKKMKNILLPVFCLIVLAFSGYAQALEIVPFESSNQGPLAGLYGLPGPGRFLLLPQGKREFGLKAALASNYTVNDSAREQITLDGETTRLTVAARYGFSSRLELGLEIPYVLHGGGFLDGFIESYHDTFGFPQGGRDTAPRNRLLYRYRRDGMDRFNISSSQSGLGDLSVKASLQLYNNEGAKRALALHTALKTPTGKSGELLGSGSTDLALWLTGGAGLGEAAGPWQAYGAAGMMFMTEGDVLPDQQKKMVGFGSLGLGWMPLARLALKVQADGHTPFFRNSELRELSGNALQIIMGGTVALSDATALDIGVSEDLAVNTSPDVVFYLDLNSRF